VNRLRQRLADFFLAPRVYIVLPLLIAVFAAIQQVVLTVRSPIGGVYAHYNNYAIFRQAFVHLLDGRNLYGFFPAEHFDNFLYSPTFAALMAPFAVLPVWPGLLAWDLFNAAVLVAGVRSLPGLDARSRSLFVWFILLELIGALQHSQTNPMVVGLLLLSFSSCERERPWPAALFLALAGSVKIFPLVAGLAFLLYPQRVRLVLGTAAWVVVLAALPLLFVSPAELAWQYGNWWVLHTTSNHAAGLGMSAAGILHSWFHVDPPRGVLLAIAGAIAALPLTNVGARERLPFRAAFFGSMLMWMIAFNHLAESPTFVIAMAGIGLWYFYQERTGLHLTLLWMALLLVSVSYSDLVSRAFRERFIHPYSMKALPVVVIWAVAVLELTLRRAPGPGARSV
jgi:hypothetical protein